MLAKRSQISMVSRRVSPLCSYQDAGLFGNVNIWNGWYWKLKGLTIFAYEGFGRQLQLSFWRVLLACAIALVFTIPIGVIGATINQGIDLNVVSELILGYLYPGKPLSFLTFKSYCMICMSHTLGFLRDLKLVYYMKIPPGSFFIAQVVGMVVSSSVSYGVTWWLLSSVENICDLTKLPKGSPWTCPIEHVGNSIIAIWGIVGPPHMFAPYGQYSMLYIFFLVGVLGPLVVWIMTLVFPTKKWIRLINLPYSCSNGRLSGVSTPGQGFECP